MKSCSICHCLCCICHRAQSQAKTPAKPRAYIYGTCFRFREGVVWASGQIFGHSTFTDGHLHTGLNVRTIDPKLHQFETGETIYTVIGEFPEIIFV